MSHCILQIALDTPLDSLFDYRWACEPGSEPEVGQLALVNFGRREAVGLIVAVKHETDVPADKLKDALAVRGQLSPLPARWIALARFAAAYYHRPLGEVAMPGLPKNVRLSTTVALDRALKKLAKLPDAHDPTPADMPVLNAAQQQAADAIGGAQGFSPLLLYGVTGSGKTEVYLQACAQVLQRDADAQILILVPEINLTPQLEANIRARFPGVMLATLHSSLSEGERMLHWLAAHTGRARIVLGTRLAILASLPNLKMIVIDEEHDPSYKQQEGLRYSARDLAVWRARQLGIPIVLGSATPSLESWHHAQTGRYRRLELRERAVRDAVLPRVKLVDMERDKPKEGLTSTLMQALRLRMERGEQSLLFLNRRGYAPVLCCEACGWISNCTRCTAFMVLHRPERRLRCHHCSLELRIPHACPTCGNIDLQPLGRGTQRVEEGLQALFPDARILRIDADSTRRKGSAQEAFDTVHRGDVDILIGTQMVAKGHDFKRLTLVGVLNPDTALFSQDYRASERLFAQLMQVAGRAGRAGLESEVLIQSRYCQHPLYGAVMRHDYDRFAGSLLEERHQAALPPYMYQALLRAEAPELATAIEFLEAARDAVPSDTVVINEPIPMTMTRVHNVDRAQLLVESNSRPALQAFLTEWVDVLRAMKSRVRWSLEVDPLDI
ncbi:MULTISPECIES: primosomal protein N' [Massilia]|uniref:Primosomal protein N n=1 Tax=Massilia orientalis TaxID=3050128 RepID=A0ACC7MEH9_9BURK|nr:MULTISPECIES: primosomal protein N' [unclassified Massilia]KQY14850.1 primosomal protein N' [Massilia sp. Root133]KQZ43669.1 primosomal protein N' [Massilia sp. Root1485]MDN4044476.1 primosomal protein N' [Massilia sp. YIM B02787]